MSISTAQRGALVDAFTYLTDHGSHIGYAQKRPYDAAPYELRSRTALERIFAQDGDAQLEWDCDVFTVEGFHLAGLRDPSGYGYDGYGNTSTMLAYLAPGYSDPAAALPGALVVFGADLALQCQHVAVVGPRGTGTSNPWLWSHGQPGVRYLPLAEEQTAHQGATVFLSPGRVG